MVFMDMLIVPCIISGELIDNLTCWEPYTRGFDLDLEIGASELPFSLFISWIVVNF